MVNTTMSRLRKQEAPVRSRYIRKISAPMLDPSILLSRRRPLRRRMEAFCELARRDRLMVGGAAR
jgi:hypothetical protein